MSSDFVGVLLHGLLPSRGDFSIALLGVGVFAAVFVGALVAESVRTMGWAAPLLPPFVAGALVFLLHDLLKESASLGQGLVSNPLLQAGLLASFTLGVLFLPYLGGGLEQPAGLAWLWSLGIAAHGAGEGWIVGTEVGAPELLAPLGTASFLLHKGIEGATIPVVAGAALRPTPTAMMAFTIAAVAVVAAAGGHAFPHGQPALFLFAVGAGALTFAVVRTSSMFVITTRSGLALVVGLAAVYGAGLLHEL